MLKSFAPAFSLLLLAAGAPAMAGEGTSSAPTPEQISGWIRALDDEDYAKREAAVNALAAAGRVAIGPVAKAILSESPEAAWRANGVLEQIGISGDEQTFELVSQAFDEISKSHKSAAAKSAVNLQSRWKQLRHERAVVQIAKLGGHVHSSGVADGGMVVFGGGFGGFGGGMMPAIAIVEEPEGVPEDPPVEPAKSDEAAIKEDLGLFPGKDARDLLEVLRKGKPLPEDVDPLKVEFFPAPRAPVDPFEPDLIEPPPPVRPAGFFGKIMKAFREVVPLGEPALPMFDEPPAFPVPPAEAIELVEFAEVGMDVGFDVFGGEAMEGGSHVIQIGKEWKGTAQDFKLFKDVQQLQSVQLAEIEVTSEHIDQLGQLTDLMQLNLQRCRFDRVAIEKLKKTRPELSVLTFGDAVLGISGEAQGEGFHVSFVAPNSGAAAAGIQVDDIIKSIGGEELRTFEGLTHIIASHKVGDKVSVKFERQGKPQTVEVTLKTREAVP